MDIDFNPEEFLLKAEKIFSAKKNRPVLDTQAPLATPQEVAHSGSALFRDQAACPFRAFAIHRLKAKEPQRNQLGLSYADRGTLIHKILEKIWQKLQSHQQLCELEEAELKTLIQITIQQALLPLELKPKFQQLETQRLEQIIYQWLLLEKKRESFTITALEKKQSVTLGQYPSHIRIDRIDQLENGNYVVLDYKTGECSEQDWYGDRPDAPQIPLYCIASEYPPSDAGFAQISANKMRFKGLGSVKNWTEQIQRWETVLKNLAEQFESGDANVDPKDPTQTCKYCHLKMVCRVKDDNTQSFNRLRNPQACL